MIWKLGKIQFPIYNLGYGKRIGIWVQGCSLGCRDCINKELWGKDRGKGVSVIDVTNLILLLQNGFEGVTISGGEPFQQYEQLISFLFLLKKKTNLSVQCFTGYYLDELYELYPDRLFLNYIDILVDGRYVKTLHENRNIRGSSNQTVYHIVDQVPRIRHDYYSPNLWSVKVDESNQIYMAGIPKKNELEILSEELNEKGFNIRFI